MNSAQRLAIGTAQFGLDCGISNDRGKVPAEVAKLILRSACAAEITTVDTAAGYGDLEFVLAGALPDLPECHVITKTVSMAHGTLAVVERAWRSSNQFRGCASCALLVHSAGDLKGSEGSSLWHALLQLREKGCFTIVGVTSPEELGEILSVANAPLQDLPWQEFAMDDDVLLDPRKWRSV